METKRPTNPAAEEILGGYFPVLDHGFVALVDYMGTDEDIERAARVSYGYGTRKVSQTRGLVRYLRRHHHTTPSEMVDLKFHCGNADVRGPAVDTAQNGLPRGGDRAVLRPSRRHPTPGEPALQAAHRGGVEAISADRQSAAS